MTPAEMRAAAERLREGLFPEQGAWRTSDIEAGADALERLAAVIEYAERQDENDTEAWAVLHLVLRIARGES